MKSLYTSPLNVSEYIIKYFINKKNCINVIQLQQILYLIQLESNCKIFSNDFEAWAFGPVMPCVYHKYKSNGANTIKTFSLNINLTGFAKEIVDNILNIIENLTPGKLTSLIHIKDGAWDICYSDSKINKISKAKIKNDLVTKNILKELKG